MREKTLCSSSAFKAPLTPCYQSSQQLPALWALVGVPNGAEVLGKVTSAGEVLANCLSLILSAAWAHSA